MQTIRNGECPDSPYWIEVEPSKCGRYCNYYLCHKDRKGFAVRKDTFAHTERCAFDDLLRAEVELGLLSELAYQHAVMTPQQEAEWIAERRRGGEIIDW